MKVYWSSSKGAVICSANASAGALGSGGLKEAGVWVPKGAVDIHHLLRYAQPRPIYDVDLRSLAHESDRIASMAPTRKLVDENDAPSLTQWLASPAHKGWKLGWWDHVAVVAKQAKAEAFTRYGVREPFTSQDCLRDDYRVGDWVLQFNRDGGRSASWMYVDFVIKGLFTDLSTAI
jgi:hypothetical protein